MGSCEIKIIIIGLTTYYAYVCASQVDYIFLVGEDGGLSGPEKTFLLIHCRLRLHFLSLPKLQKYLKKQSFAAFLLFCSDCFLTLH